MKNNKKISVLMSTYKNDNVIHLKEAIDSIINQTLKPNEIIIIIDGDIPQKNMDALLDYSKKDKNLKKM